jgi:hypothetical protein
MATLTAQGVTTPLVIVCGSVNFGDESQDTTFAGQGNVSPGIPVHTPTNRIITDDQTIDLKVRFTASGALMGYITGAKWVMQLHLEYYGPAESTPVLPVTMPVVTVPTATTYNATIQFPSGLSAGLYRCVFTLTLVDSVGDAIPAGAFADMGNILVLAD